MNDGKLGMHVSESGPPLAHTIVFLHSLLADHSMFTDVIGILRGAYRCVAVDFRCHGASTDRCPADMHIEQLVQDVHDALLEIDAMPCHFVGHSLGGIVALRFARRFPALARRMVIAGADAEAETEPVRVVKHALNDLLLAGGLESAMGGILDACFTPEYFIGAEGARHRQEWSEALRRNRPATYGLARCVLDRDAFTADLQRIASPVLLVAGSEDLVFPVQAVQACARALRDSRMNVVQRAGHMMLNEQPAHCAELIAEFLKEGGGAG